MVLSRFFPSVQPRRPATSAHRLLWLAPFLLSPALMGINACGETDTDADGWSVEAGDCDDTNPQIHPEAEEYCNGIDEDCDDLVDDAPVDGALMYADADGDGYGDPDNTLVACAGTAPGYVFNHTDCDDTDAEIHPNRAEWCDGIDNDCDGVADEPTASDAGTWWADYDEDGYGDKYNYVYACEQPEHMVGNNDDCDDRDGTVYPGAQEVQDDKDNDCDGVVDEQRYLAVSTFDANDEGWTLTGDPTSPTPKWDYNESVHGGYISGFDAGGGKTFYYLAPAAFLGNKADAYGGTLSFELKQSETGYQSTTDDDVSLKGGTVTLLFNTANNPATSWTAYQVPLVETAGWRNAATGKPATREELIAVLSSLSELRIRGEFATNIDSSSLDSVVLDAGAP